MKNNTVNFSFLLVAFFFLSGISNIQAQTWELESRYDNFIFPSTIIADAMSSGNNHKISKDEKGDLNGWYTAIFKNTKPNQKVSFLIEAGKYWEASKVDFVLENAQEYLMHLNFTWKFEELRKATQPSVENVKITMIVNDKTLDKKSLPASVRSVYECMYLVTSVDEKKQEQYEDLADYYCAYVNEDHPSVDKLLKDGLATKAVDMYDGYQSGDEKAVLKQVFSIWQALRNKGIQYSSITETSIKSEFVHSQRVRPISESLNNKQANCVDGTVLFASALRAIDIKPVLVTVPGHMFLGFYLDENKQKLTFLETTMIGEKTAKTADAEWKLFNNAIIAAKQEFYKNFNKKYEPLNDESILVDVEEARQHIKPIGL